MNKTANITKKSNLSANRTSVSQANLSRNLSANASTLVNLTANISANASVKKEEKVWIQPTPKSAIKKVRTHQNLVGKIRDFSVEEQKKFQRVEEAKLH
jgi:hypothetical protein